MRCDVCQVTLIPGALVCACGAPAPVAIAAAQAAGGAAAWAPPPVAVAGPAAPLGRRLRFAAGTAEYPLPGADFDELLVGRHDLIGDPPVVVDLDLGPIAPKRGAGFAISRRQARLSRRHGRLILTALGGAQTLLRKAGKSFALVPIGAEVELAPGDRIVFGSGDAALALDVD